ncbi:MAG TPA: TRAP transporter small permease [Ensifer sp.]|jgi:TRAP-type C4-dicarboxylate transport system permease small subunit|uniref:TRAP transporter small permease n=1 Tax=Ensifer sp. TaxID=1872086 RepID=UPI002E12C578|nr:TRAP transporter small permease [Ensifer sp.]
MTDNIDSQETVNVPRRREIERLAGGLALIGGTLLCLAAGLVSVSVLGRWLFNRPVPADYELVEVAVGVAAFSFLGYTQARNGHIAVDTFTLALPERLTRVIDGLWDLLLAGCLAFFAWGLFTGGLEARQYGTTLIQLPWPIWPVYLTCAVLAALAAIIGLSVAILKIGAGR